MTIKLRDRNALIATPRPNWRNPVGVEYTFRTDIFTSRNGSEVRAATRQRARIALSFTTAMTRALLARHQQDMANNQDALWAVRGEWAWVRTTAIASFPTTEIEVASIPDWMVAGQQIIIETDTHEDLHTILSVDKDTSTITLDDVTTRDYAEGSKVYLSYLSRIAASSSFNALTSRLWAGAVRYEVNPGEGEAITAIPPAFTFGSAKMLLTRPNWRENPKVSFDQVRDVFDPGYGLIDVFAPEAQNVVTVEYGFTGLSREQSDELVAFFLAMKGRRTSFWVPLWFDDIQPSDDQIGGADLIKIEGEDFRNAYEDHPVFQSVIVFYDDCTYQANTITSIGGSTDSEVLFEDDWSQEINSQTKMYWLVRARFQSDTLDVQWVTNETAEVTFAMRSLPHTKVSDWPTPAEVLAMAPTGEPVASGDLRLDPSTPSQAGILIDLYAAGLTPEMIAEGNITLGVHYSGTYQAGTPLADSDTLYTMSVRYHDSGDAGPASQTADLVAGTGTTSIGPSSQGPDVLMELGPLTIPTGARWVQIKTTYAAAVTSNPVTLVSGYVIKRPTTGSLAGTSLC